MYLLNLNIKEMELLHMSNMLTSNNIILLYAKQKMALLLLSMLSIICAKQKTTLFVIYYFLHVENLPEMSWLVRVDVFILTLYLLKC